MEFPRLSTPPSVSIHDFSSNNNDYGRHHPIHTSSSPFATTSTTYQFPSRGPMAIPTKDMTNFAPPPLPPPTRISDLESGHDTAWLHANSKASSATTKLPPINPSSSLFGGHYRPEPVNQPDPMVLDDPNGGQSRLSFSRSFDARIKIEPPMDGRFPNFLSVSTNLSGSFRPADDLDCSRRSVKDSSDAYDQHLLSKIGKTPSPSPRQSVSLGSDGSRSLLTTSLPVPSKNYNLPSPGADGSTGMLLDARWHNSPQSDRLSPGVKIAWRDYLDCHSPGAESSAPSSAVDYDLRDAFRRQAGGATPQHEDVFSLPSRSNRGSYDQSVFSDIEGDLTTDDTPGLSLRLREATPPPYLDPSRPGMKRRASSPPRDPAALDRLTVHTNISTGDLTQRKPSPHLFMNLPSSGYSPSRASLSASSSSSLRTHGSFSSTGFSLAGSSMTSVSSYDRPSSGGVSPTCDFDSLHDKSLLNPSPPGTMAGLSVRSTGSLDPRSASAARKMPMQTAVGATKAAGSKIGGLYICDCCHKKPKKFDTAEELRAHEMEKQYTCQFCNNRFKNKNEAERHQNSLHLRRHSWSCAALLGYQAAFHPSPSPSAQTNAGSSHDTCGYCGEEFPNFPQPDWDRRFEHLTTVHKFGECNNAKKFYRADHFRQHLKHSHAGTSGKWTNILENACMKEEPPAESKVETNNMNNNLNEPRRGGTRGSLSSNGSGGAGGSSVPPSSTMGSGTLTTSNNTINAILG